ncbi:MAG: bifunctional DNA-formamidopyrimidine glycosylase/DNA-(apurinic or apyrimidinic site) lyase [Ectothiorhodospiraceae bacterium]|nr:bifunctional DNA-formamidopyrimidine glycosylase/DNA-(apurinic or apyrimidinic site) lyase [Chromatiales bacterium]MCP5156481.1 bifunctional DNA-formamidopyrimidine glycosylase/DNA-(apurinic or apyrimidinic site) lyase [Ectothiorhodospiraceae bacterium]
MPELPEVETTRRGLAPRLVGRVVTAVAIRDRRLRWPVPEDLGQRLVGREVRAVGRRAKYLLIAAGDGTLLLHLGMSGSLRVVPADTAPRPHDHLDVVLDDGHLLRLHDPRRFGAALWVDGDPLHHPLLARLGPEPLEPGFDGTVLHAAALTRRAPVKCLLMDAHVVVGVGNIYASEALHLAGIHPTRPARRVGAERYARLAGAVRSVLSAAIDARGTTLRDYVDERGAAGEFSARLKVYGRAGQPCEECATPIRSRVVAQRSTFFCPRCQR